ncbi:Tim44/TimA family putative adaptor protein [Frigidibacter sp. MR17.24]|uniref:Tim44/TimA family putative adaptor protein n=1 Tax=Frigidibacter sp. MR17.24 TaxID=3127345 RepID=UPI003012CB1A
MSNALIQLLVLAGVAIFLILRLKAVLGSREGFEKPPVQVPDQETAAAPRRGFEVIEGGPDRDIADHVPETSPAFHALAAMKQAEPGFSVAEFLKGAGGAYEMILIAFETGKLDPVKPFLSPEVRDSFEAAVAERAARGLTTEATFLGLRELALQDAEFDPASRLGEVTVRMTGELVTATRDAGGELVDGDPKASRRQRDVWTFARTMGAEDPNWQLVATGE